jgi:hypothetical protein
VRGAQRAGPAPALAQARGRGHRARPASFSELERIERAHTLEPALLHAGIFARGYVAFFKADLAAALQLFEQLVPAEHAPSVFHEQLAGRALALGHLACVRCVIGEPERALDEARRTLTLADRVNVPILQALGHVVLGRVRYLRRDPPHILEEDALHAVRAASLDLGLLTEASAFAPWAEAERGPLALAAIAPSSGHLDEARALTEEIITFATGRGERVYLPELLSMRSALCEESDPVAAEHGYREAIALAEATGAFGLSRRASEGLAALTSQKTGRGGPRRR